MVCACFGVGVNTVMDAIAKQKLTTPEMIGYCFATPMVLQRSEGKPLCVHSLVIKNPPPQLLRFTSLGFAIKSFFLRASSGLGGPSGFLHNGYTFN